MTSSLRRAASFALVATLALAAPALGRATAVPFGIVALFAFGITDGRAFELLARPGDYRDGRLHGLLGFSLAIAGLALLAELLSMPSRVFVATVLLVGYGNLGAKLVAAWRSTEILRTTGFAVGGFLAGVAGQLSVAAMRGAVGGVDAPEVVFLAASGALLAALLREAFFGHEEPLMLFSVAPLLWLFADLRIAVSGESVAVALAVTVAFGYLSWALDTASIAGMLTGVLLCLLTVVLGGYGWFAVLLAFFAIGGLSSKFRYDVKERRGVAEPEGGARGSGNVLGNSAPALAAVVLFAASEGGRVPVGSELFLYAFAGSVATALGDTLSSEIGGLFDDPRLITTFRTVPPGTDGGVTWQGELAGVGGATLIAALVVGLFDLGVAGASAVVVAGVAGMTADSLLGATVEGGAIGNQTVNFLATSTGAVTGGVLALAIGLGGP